MVIMAVRFLTTLLTISMVLGTGRALSCYECEGTVISVNGMVAHVEETGLDSDGNCKQSICDSGMDTCLTGTWTYKYKNKVKAAGSSDWLSMENNMVYQKVCGLKTAATCDAIKTALTIASEASASDNGREVKDIELSACEVETCDTDNCNTKTPKEINSAYSEPISCYTCAAIERDGLEECTDDNKETCPFGVTQCVYGNFEMKDEVEVILFPQHMEYFKGCGGNIVSNCDVLKFMMELSKSSGGKVDIDCNIGSCSGDLCNTQTVEEVKAHDSGSSAVQSAVILLTASILYFIG